MDNTGIIVHSLRCDNGTGVIEESAPFLGAGALGTKGHGITSSGPEKLKPICELEQIPCLFKVGRNLYLF